MLAVKTGKNYRVIPRWAAIINTGQSSSHAHTHTHTHTHTAHTDWSMASTWLSDHYKENNVRIRFGRQTSMEGQKMYIII